jgi:hypothetical protein
MDVKEKRRQYYINNKDRILEKSKQYYHDNKEQRQKYNQDYWALHGQKYVDKRKVDEKFKESYKQYYQNNKDKIIETNKKYYYDNREALLHYYASISHIYIEKRRHDREYKAKQREYYKTYYQVYKERPKYIYQNNYFVPPSKKDFIVSFPSY